jgi:chromosome segregation ATPase
MMRIIYYGVGRSYRLFIQIVYTALSCLWRKEETDSNNLLYDSIKHSFNPFCENRLKARGSEWEKAESLKNAIDLIVKHELRNLENTDKAPDSFQSDDSRERNMPQPAQYKRLKTLFEEMRKEKEKAIREKSSLKEDKEMLKKQLSEKDNHLEDLETQYENLDKSLSEKDNSLKSLEIHYENLEKSLSETNKNLENLKVNYKKLEKSLSEKQVSLKDFEIHNENMGKALSETDNNLKNLEEKYIESNKVNTTLNENNKILKSRNKIFKEEIERKNKENADLTNERDILSAQNNEMSQKFKAFGTDLNKFIKEHRNDLKKDMEDNYSKFMVLGVRFRV